MVPRYSTCSYAKRLGRSGRYAGPASVGCTVVAAAGLGRISRGHRRRCVGLAVRLSADPRHFAAVMRPLVPRLTDPTAGVAGLGHGPLSSASPVPIGSRPPRAPATDDPARTV